MVSHKTLAIEIVAVGFNNLDDCSEFIRVCMLQTCCMHAAEYRTELCAVDGHGECTTAQPITTAKIKFS